MHPAFKLVARSIALVSCLSLAVAGPATAKEPVDPNTLNPAPPDFFNATCERTGSQILCNLAFSDPPIVSEASGIVCGTTELLVSQTRDVVGKRFYDSDGNLTRRHFREALAGSLTNPSTDHTVDWVAHNTIVHDLSVPGDIASGQTTVSGQQMRIFGSHGTVLIDVGRIVIDEATGELLKSSGKHHLDDYFLNGNTAAIELLCAALA